MLQGLRQACDETETVLLTTGQFEAAGLQTQINNKPSHVARPEAGL